MYFRLSEIFQYSYWRKQLSKARAMAGTLLLTFRDAELERMRFDDGTRSVVSIRGKYSTNGSASFQWTKAVKALTRLAIGRLQNSNYMDADKSLYQAMVKKKDWYIELFGATRICTMTEDRIHL
jgi:hypothetical protein